MSFVESLVILAVAGGGETYMLVNYGVPGGLAWIGVWGIAALLGTLMDSWQR